MRLITQQGFVMVDTREPRSERQFSLSHQPTPENWGLGLDAQGNVTPVQITRATRGRRRICRKSFARRALRLAWDLRVPLVAMAIVLGAIVIGPKVPAFLNWITQ
jgi:hypothetical protein